MAMPITLRALATERALLLERQAGVTADLRAQQRIAGHRRRVIGPGLLGEPPDRAVHAPRVAAVQVLEGTHVAARGTAHRVRIGVVGAFRDRRFRTRHGECEGVHPDNIDAPGHAGV